MAQKVQIQFRQPDLQPPVYIAGSLGESQWEPIEMVFKEEAGEVYFSHEFDAEPGDYQYKFRLGPGDWWVLDESKPTVDDGFGNRNNLLVVEPASISNTKEEDLDEPQASVATAPISATNEQSTDGDDEAVEGAREVPETELNSAKHQSNYHVDRNKVEQESESAKSDEQPPLLEHEEGPFKRVDSKNLDLLKTDNSVFVDPAEFEVEADDGLSDDSDDSDQGPPLFRHESMSATDADPDEAPLFRHESMSPLEIQSPFSHVSPSSRKRCPVNTEDVEDPSLEAFPTDQAGIMAHLHRTETRLREDETAFEGTPLSPSLAQKKSFEFEAPLTHERTNETNDLVQLDSIDEREEPEEVEEAEEAKGTKGLGLDSPTGTLEQTSELVSDDTAGQDVSDTPLDNQPATTSHVPLTPPMTPTEHAHDKASAYHDGPADAPEPALSNNDGVRSRKANATDHITSRSTPPQENAGNKSTQGLISRLWFCFAGLCGGTARATGVAFAMSVAAAAFAINSRS